MTDIIETIGKIFSITNEFIPPTVFYVVIPFIGIMAFFKIIREVK